MVNNRMFLDFLRYVYQKNFKLTQWAKILFLYRLKHREFYTNSYTFF